MIGPTSFQRERITTRRPTPLTGANMGNTDTDLGNRVDDSENQIVTATVVYDF